MIPFLIILLVILYVVIRNPLTSTIFGGQEFEDIYVLQQKIHEYSGLDKETYMSYLVSIDNTMAFITMDPVNASGSLYKSLDKLRDLAGNIPAGDSEIPHEINTLADKLGKTTEHYIMKYALQNGFIFTPRYLNNRFISLRDNE